MKKLLFLLIVLQALLLLPAAAPAADTWDIPDGTPVGKAAKATAILNYTDSGKDVIVKYTITSYGFHIDRSPLETRFTLQGADFQISAKMAGGGFQSGLITTVSATAKTPASSFDLSDGELFLSDTARGLSWRSDPDSIMAAVAEGTFTEILDKATRLPGDTINFKLTYTIEGTLSNGKAGRLVVTFTGSKLAGI